MLRGLAILVLVPLIVFGAMSVRDIMLEYYRDESVAFRWGTGWFFLCVLCVAVLK